MVHDYWRANSTAVSWPQLFVVSLQALTLSFSFCLSLWSLCLSFYLCVSLSFSLSCCHTHTHIHGHSINSFTPTLDMSCQQWDCAVSMRLNKNTIQKWSTLLIEVQLQKCLGFSYSNVKKCLGGLIDIFVSIHTLGWVIWNLKFITSLQSQPNLIPLYEPLPRFEKKSFVIT